MIEKPIKISSSDVWNLTLSFKEVVEVTYFP